MERGVLAERGPGGRGAGPAEADGTQWGRRQALWRETLQKADSTRAGLRSSAVTFSSFCHKALYNEGLIFFFY